MKTTVKGYVIQRVHPKMGEIERWAVDKNRLHYGYIVKVSYKIHHEFDSRVRFWYCISEKRYGKRVFTDKKVGDTRTEVILKLAHLREKSNVVN